MNIICLEEEAFYALVEQVVNRLKTTNTQDEDKWISDKEAMRKLRIKSKSTLQKFRDEGKIRYSQPERKIILYDSESINDFLKRNSKDTFK